MNQPAPPQSQWLEPFLSTNFYGICQTHKRMRRNRLHYYCTNCTIAICPHCTAMKQHENHDVLQIRLASGAWCIVATEIAGLIDTAGLHSFKINGKYIHFLSGRRGPEGSRRKPPCRLDSVCAMCRWTLPGGVTQESRFCSIRCKLKYGSSSSSPLTRIEIPKVNEEDAVGKPLQGKSRPCVVGTHDKRRDRRDVPHQKADPETSAAELALKKNGSPCEQKTTSTTTDTKKRAGRQEGFKVNGGIAMAGDHTIEEKLGIRSRTTLRARQRKGTPRRSAEFATPDETRHVFFPW